MKTITKTFNLYEFKELSKESQEKAITDHIDFEIDTMDERSYLYNCVTEMDKMQTPWFLGSYIYEKHKEDIIETIKVNKYLFFQDGELIPKDYYPDEEGEVDANESNN